MKKVALILIGLCLIITSCGKKIDKTIKYNGSKDVNIVLQESYNLNASSEEELTYYSDNSLIVTVDKNGKIFGKNIGEANITISNSENSVNIHVNVTLFEEPTLDFGCNQEKILSLYGQPTISTDSVIIYTNWYSYAVWSMSFFFKDNEYYESDLYIRNDLDLRIDQYLEENFYYYGKLTDDNNNDIYVYLDAADESNATVMVAKMYHANKDDDICLIYVPYTSENRLRFRR